MDAPPQSRLELFSQSNPPGPAAGVATAEPHVVAAPGPGHGLSRRAFLSGATRGALAASALGAAAFSLDWLSASAPAPSQRALLGPVHLFGRGTVSFVFEPPVFVFHDAQGIGVLSARCSHLGCTVQRAPQGFVCPCHGARFDEQGEVLSGPAPRPLGWLECGIDANAGLWVEPTRPGDARQPAESSESS